jgi:hypothetical protein
MTCVLRLLSSLNAWHLAYYSLGEGGFTNLLQKEDFDFLFYIEAERS